MQDKKNSAKAQEEALETAAQKKAPESEDVFANFDFENLEVDLKEMFKAGVHFGHQKAKKNPKMAEYIFGAKNGINIIDLEKTVRKLEEAQKFLDKIVSEGQEVLLVGAKKQAKKLVEAAAKKCEMPYVVERWLGGTFTNYRVISSRTRYLKDMQEKMKKGELTKYTKFEQMKIAEELEKMETKMGGIKNMVKLPGAIIITGVVEDNLAIKEARKKGVPIVGLVDTNVSPSEIDFPIPANEDAVSSLKLMLAYLMKTILDAKEKAVVKVVNSAK